MSLFQIRDGEAQVALRGGQGTVPQAVLDVPQVGVVLNEMRGTGVTSDVRGHDLLDPRRLGVLFDQGAEGMGIQRIAPVGEEEAVKGSGRACEDGWTSYGRSRQKKSIGRAMLLPS
jgi:hypothetical protein